MNIEYQVTSFLDDIEGWKYVLNSLPDLIAILNTEHEIIWANTAMISCLNISPGLCLGVKCFKAIHGTELPIDNCPHAKMIRDNEGHTEEVYEINLGGHFLVTAAPIRNKSGNILGSVHIARDITERKIMEKEIKKSLQEREMLIKETHHRVKNNLMVISSLLNLQARYINDKKMLNIFKDSQNRARSMALIHEKLYQTTDLERINFGDYIQNLAMELFRTYSDESHNIKMSFDVENYNLDINTSIPLGLVVNELVSNSLKHAFPTASGCGQANEKFADPANKIRRFEDEKSSDPDDRNGTIKLKFYKENEKYALVISDNGIGLPDDFEIETADSLGLRIVASLIGQIHGDIEIEGTHGANFTIKFEESIF